MVDTLAKTQYNTHIATHNRKHTMTHTTGLIRIVVGLLCVMGAVGGMEQQPDAPLLAQTAIAVVGLVLMLWAARDINRTANNTINRYKD